MSVKFRVSLFLITLFLYLIIFLDKIVFLEYYNIQVQIYNYYYINSDSFDVGKLTSLLKIHDFIILQCTFYY